jgi:hypothetical protein
MTLYSRLRTFLLRAFLLGFALTSPLVALAADIELGMIKGDVSVLPAGSARPQPAVKGAALRAGDRVYTGRDGWATLLVPDGSRLVLTADSEFLVRSHDAKRRTGTFALLTGMLRAIITPSPAAPPNYRFNTLTAIAGVRGTDFSLIHRGQANVFFGNTGTVEVQGLNTEARALTAATVVQSTRGIVPTLPIRIEPNSRLAEARNLLNEITDQAPASWAEAGKLPEIIARWNITYSRYLADAGRSDEALHVLQVALDLTDMADIQADAHLERGAVFSRNPKQAEAALLEYAAVLAAPYADTPAAAPQRETALYMSGMGLYQLNRAADARAHLQQYLRDYPDGRFKARADTLLRSLDQPAH